MGPGEQPNQTIATHDWQTKLPAFALAYGFLSKALYQPPEVEFINALFKDDLFSDWPLGNNTATAQTGLSLLKSFGDQWTADQHTALHNDFNALFVGPGPLLAYPWESVYLSKEKLIFDEQTLEVRAFYRRFGLQAPTKQREPDDHIGLEFAFMVHLCSVGMCALEQEDHTALDQLLQAQSDFLEEHLLRWAPLCLQRIIDNAQTEYYQGVAHLGLDTLNMAAQLFNLEVEPEEVK
jgi:putative dimethyl sulfoxide reductase chaperone